MSELKPYPKYKDSGVEWIGEIPEGWEKVKLSWLFNEIGSGSTPNSNNESYYKNGCINWINTGDLNDNYLSETKNKITQFALDKLSTIRIYPKNSLVVAMYGATIGKLAITKIEAATNQACCVLTNPRNTNIKFIFYWFLANRENIINLASGGGQPNISQSLIKSLHVYLPKTVSEQNNIVKYLDKRIKQINSLIFDKKHLIKLLEEKRQAIITETVTKGLNPNVEMKDSGIDWIGEIPEHWKVTKLKYVGNITMGQSPKANYVNDEKKGLPFLQGNAEFTERYPEAIYYCDNSPRVAKKGSLLMSVRAPVGELNNADKSYAIGRGLCAIKANDNNNTDYLYYLLSFTRTELYSKMVGSTFEAVTVRDVRELITLQPPLKEQLGIVEHLNKVNNDINSIVLDIQNQISKLKEYRESLIYEAVTGKIDLRNYEPKGDIDEAH